MTAMPRPTKPRHSSISFRILTLEPRMMFDGAAAGDVADKTAADSKAAATDTAAPAAATTTDTSAKSAAAAAEADKSAATATVVRWNGQVSTDTTGSRHEVVVVDTTVADWQTLVAGINPNTPIILLSPNANGMGELEVLAQIMKQFHDLDAIHLVAEGRTGAILLGNEVLYSGDMTAASPYLAIIGAALKDGGDFMLYSCSVAKSDGGKAFVDSFARALGNVDVAASTDLTGPTRLGGDWDLEYKTGDIETVLPFTLAGMQDISHCLGCSTNAAKDTLYVNGEKAMHWDSGQKWVTDIDLHYHADGSLIPAGTDMLDFGMPLHPDDGEYVQEFFDECYGPSVVTINRVSSETVPTASTSVSYTVTFSEAVTGVDASDFTLTPTGTAAGTIGTVTGSGITWTVTLTGVTGEGTLRLDLKSSGTGIKSLGAADISGGFTAGQTYNLDHVAPNTPTVAISADTGSNTSDGVTKTATQTVTVTAEGGTTLDIDYGDGSAHGTASGSHTYTADGKYTISVTATDAAGNVSNAGTKVIVVDRSAPTNITPSVTQLAVTDATNGATFCALSATDGTSITGYTDAWTYTLGGTDSGKFSIVGGNLVINNSGGLTAGSYSVDVTATDTAGNTYTKTLTLSVVSGPSTTVSAASLSDDTGGNGTDWITNTATQTITGTLSAALVAGEKVQVSFDNGSTWQDTAATTGDTSFSFAATLSGTDTFKARVTDSIGSSTAFSHTYALDTTVAAPSAPDMTAGTDSGTNTDNITNATTPTFTGTAEKGATVTLYDTDGTTVLGTAVADATTGIWTITSSALSEGVHTVKAKAVDVAGNVSTLSTGLAVTIDTTAPDAPSAPDLAASSDSGTDDTDNITTNTTPTFTGTAERGATVTLYDTNGTTVLGTAVADATTGAWSITSSALGIGSHTVTAKATDAAGNTSAALPGLAVTIVTGPAAPTGLAINSADDTGSSNSDNITKTAAQTISGSAPPGASVLIFKDGAQVGTVTADATTGAWSYATGALADGTHVFTAKARVSEQDSAASTPLSITVDSAAPASPAVTGISGDGGSSASDGITSDRTLVINGTTEAGSTVEVFKDGISIGTATVTGTTWSFDYTGTSLTDGTYVFTAKATDLAGNVSTLSSGLTVKVTPNVNAPTASGTALVAPKGTEGSAYTFPLPVGSFTDADVGDTLTYTASGLPAGLTIDGTTGVISGTPGSGGSYTVTITATDSVGLTATKTVTIAVDMAPTAATPATGDGDGDGNGPAAPAAPAGNADSGGSAQLVTTVREPTVTDKPAGMETVVRTVNLTPSDTANAGFSVNSGAIGTGTGSGGITAGLGGGITSALGDTRSSSGGTFQVALAGRAPGGGDALVVNTRVPDASFDAGSRISVTVPGDAFAHTRADASVTLSATRGDGAALPGWMSFNPRTGTFEGTPPPNFRGEVVVKVTARDSDGRQVVQTFKIVVGQGRGNAVPDGGGEGRSQGAPGRSGDLGPDGKLAGKAVGRTGLTEQLRQMSFKGGVARHIAMFDTITRGDKVA